MSTWKLNIYLFLIYWTSPRMYKIGTCIMQLIHRSIRRMTCMLARSKPSMHCDNYTECIATIHVTRSASLWDLIWPLHSYESKCVPMIASKYDLPSSQWHPTYSFVIILVEEQPTCAASSHNVVPLQIRHACYVTVPGGDVYSPPSYIHSPIP